MTAMSALAAARAARPCPPGKPPPAPSSSPPLARKASSTAAALAGAGPVAENATSLPTWVPLPPPAKETAPVLEILSQSWSRTYVLQTAMSNGVLNRAISMAMEHILIS